LEHPSKFHRVVASGLRYCSDVAQRKSTKLCAMLAVFWAGALYINFRGLLSAFKSCVLLYWQRYCTALEQRQSARICGVVQGIELRNFRRGRHLCSAERPSGWASAHVLVSYYISSIGVSSYRHWCTCPSTSSNLIFLSVHFRADSDFVRLHLQTHLFIVLLRVILCMRSEK